MIWMKVLRIFPQDGEEPIGEECGFAERCTLFCRCGDDDKDMLDLSNSGSRFVHRPGDVYR